MNHQGVTEVVLFKLQEGISDEAFVRAANALMPDLTAMPGFIRRELGKDQDGSGQWVDMVYWESLEQAHQASEKIMQLPSCKPFLNMINLEGMTMLHVSRELK
jgi:hypothetical protein